MTRLTNPIPIFLDARGNLADGGSIYVGVAGANPQTNQVAVYWDQALSIPAAQPLRTMGGVIVNGATPANVFIAAQDYSMLMIDGDGNTVFTTPSTYIDTTSFQPHNANLDQIANETVTPFGIALLALANGAALYAATGVPAPLPAGGGTVTGDIKRNAAGTYVYWNDPGMISGRIFITAAGAADPTSQAGDLWLTY